MRTGASHCSSETRAGVFATTHWSVVLAAGDESSSQAGQALERQLRRINPQSIRRLPLLGVALNLRIPDNDLTRSFDAKLRKTLQVELRSLHRDVGITFVYVTHDQEEALTMSDRIAVMSAGRIEQLGSPTEVYEQPATAYVADFLGVSNLMDATASGSDGSGGCKKYTPGTVCVAAKCAVKRVIDGTQFLSPGKGFPTGYVLRVSADGSAWTEVARVQSENTHDVLAVFSPLPVQYVQIDLTAMPEPGITWMISEILIHPATPWIASASHNGDEAGLATDNRMDTAWESKAPQAPGMWFQIDLGREERVSGITLDAPAGGDPTGFRVRPDRRLAQGRHRPEEPGSGPHEPAGDDLARPTRSRGAGEAHPQA